MIAVKQIQRAFNAALASYLRSGVVPTKQEVINEIDAAVPNPGQPTTVYAPQQQYQRVDIDGYNKTWETIAEDFAVLHESCYDHAASVARHAGRSFSWSSGLMALSHQLEDEVASVSLAESAADLLSWSLATAGTLDISSTGTTAVLNYECGVAALPIDTKTFKAIDLSNARLTGQPVQGTEISITGSVLQNIISPQHQYTWMTQVIGPGGGMSYRIDLYLQKPTTFNAIVCDVTHAQNVAISFRSNGTWLSYSGEGTYKADAVSVVLTRTVGTPDIDGFRYTFGIRSLRLLLKQYASSAVVKTLETAINTDGRTVSRATLYSDETIPSNTLVSYGLTLYDGATPLYSSDETPLTIYPNNPFYLGNVSRKLETLLQPNTAQHTNWVGTNLQRVSMSGRNDRSLLAVGNGITVGELQWIVDSYEFDWDSQPYRVPGPDDWENLGSRGVLQNEISTRYLDVARGWWVRGSQSVIENNTDIDLQDSGETDTLVIPEEYTTVDIPLGSYVHLYGRSGVDTVDAVVAGVTAGSGETTIDLTVDGSPAAITYESGGLLNYPRYSIVPGESLVSPLVTRFDAVNGNDALAEDGQFFTLKAHTTYRFTARVFSSDNFNCVTPTSDSRSLDEYSWYSDRVGDLEDVTYFPYSLSSGGDSPVVLSVYLNGTPLRRTAHGMIWQFRSGWNEISVYIICREEYSDPILLGVALTPESFPSVGQDTDADPDLDYDIDTDGNVRKKISILAGSAQLRLCSLFDLRYNTPMLYHGRGTASARMELEGATPTETWYTDIYTHYVPSARIAVRYDIVPDDVPQPTSVIVTATLTTQDTTVTPEVGRMSIVLE